MMRSKVLSGLGIGAVALALAACGSSSDSGGSSSSSSATDNTPAAVTISVQADTTNVGKFSPNPATAKVGDTVKWTFDDDTNQHTVTAVDGSFDSGTHSKGDTFTHKFDKAGSFDYHCTLHANMTGKITVS
jgi:plastocyanin